MRKNIFLIGLIFFLGVLGYIILVIFNTPKTLTNKNTQNSKLQFFSQLNGLAVDSVSSTLPDVVAVMVDNHPDARPQAGIAWADVVYEAPVEGDFTRLMLVFNRNSDVAKVGPVRSARSYYLDWQAEYGIPLYMHCGGSSEALERIKKEEIFDANEFYWGKYYWRDKNLAAPHNLFTNSEKWQQLWQDYDNDKAHEWQGWLFDNKEPTTSSAASAFVIDYGAGYKVSWQFDSAINKYNRFLGNIKQVDALDEDITVDNVIVQYVKVKIIDDYGRKEIQTIGSGSVRVFRDGRIISGTWKKNNLTERTRFYDEYGDEIKLKPGKIWLQVVPNESSIIVTS